MLLLDKSELPEFSKYISASFGVTLNLHEPKGPQGEYCRFMLDTLPVFLRQWDSGTAGPEKVLVSCSNGQVLKQLSDGWLTYLAISFQEESVKNVSNDMEASDLGDGIQ